MSSSRDLKAELRARLRADAPKVQAIRDDLARRRQAEDDAQAQGQAEARSDHPSGVFTDALRRRLEAQRVPPTGNPEEIRQNNPL